MTFPEFADRLRKIIGCGANTKIFTKTLFEVILPDGDDLLEDISDNTFKAYYNGKTPINALAQKINTIKRMEQFEEYINEFDEEGTILQSLADTFIDVAPKINSCNCASILAELFRIIIEDAAANATEKKGTTTTKNTDMSEDQKEIFDNLSGALLQFAKIADSVVHDAAEKSRQNKKDHAETQSNVEIVDGEIVTEEPISTTESSGSTTIIQQQTNVVQNGDNNINITNNGTINFNL